jgi:hypothetical protein
MKAKLINGVLVVVAIVIALVLSELALRYMLFSGSDAFQSLREPSAYTIFPRDNNEDFFNDDYWKLVHLFGHRFMVEDPQPLLGWTGRFNKQTLEHSDMARLMGRRPVLLYGDSFAQCVDTTSCFEDILNHDPDFAEGHFLLNYGVGGYGTDQISLLFENTFRKYENPYVIFSLLATDMDRSMLKFRDSSKPYYEIADGKLELKGVPLHLSTDEYVKEHPPAIHSYLLNRFRNSRLNIFKRKTGKWEEQYIDQIKQLNYLILKQVVDTLKASGLDFVILLFNPEDHQMPDWRLDFLIGFCEDQQVPYICDRDLRLEDASGKTYDPDLYCISGEGHPTSYMNRLIAADLKRCVLEAGYSRETMTRNLERWKLNVEYYRRRILGDSEWMDQVVEKAKKRGIPVDSMVTLDAIYMLENH